MGRYVFLGCKAWGSRFCFQVPGIKLGSTCKASRKLPNINLADVCQRACHTEPWTILKGLGCVWGLKGTFFHTTCAQQLRTLEEVNNKGKMGIQASDGDEAVLPYALHTPKYPNTMTTPFLSESSRQSTLPCVLFGFGEQRTPSSIWDLLRALRRPWVQAGLGSWECGRCKQQDREAASRGHVAFGLCVPKRRRGENSRPKATLWLGFGF